jgi:hypothetical protein
MAVPTTIAVGAITEAEVNSWLRANRQRSSHGMTFDPDLEHEVATLMDQAEQHALLRRRLRSNVVTIEDGAVYTYPLKGRSAAVIAAAICAKNRTSRSSTRPEKPG